MTEFNRVIQSNILLLLKGDDNNIWISICILVFYLKKEK